MEKNIAHNPKSFLSKFKKSISPQLQAIDTYLKTEIPPFDKTQVCLLLDIDHYELQNIMEQKGISILNHRAFITVMQNGSGNVCKMFSRELSLGLPKTYTPQDISYIYDIDVDNVLDACAKIGKSSFLPNQLELLFRLISV